MWDTALAELFEAASQRDKRLVLLWNRGQQLREDDWIRLIRAREIDGIVALAVPGCETASKLHAMPFVSVHFSDATGVDPGWWVAADHKRGLEELLARWRKLGHKSVAMVRPERRTMGTVSRRKAFLKAAADSGWKLSDRWEVAVKNSGDLKRMLEWWHELTGEERPTAIFATDDEMAVTLMDMARVLGLRVPDDLAIAGLNNSTICTATRPQLTSIARPMREIGQAAFELLMDRIEDESNNKEPVHKLLPTKLVIRESG
jgi:DNA-binding LacI/PurR family transcriptional regulator